MSVLTRPPVQRLVERTLLGRALAGRLVAGLRAEDGVRVAAGLVTDGWTVALEHRAGAGEDGRGEAAALVAGARAAGLAGHCELTVSAQPEEARGLVAEAAAAGLGVLLDGAVGRVDALLAGHPGVRAVVRSCEPSAEARCRELGGDRVRLRAGPGAAARLAFVRCVDVLMAGNGVPAVATGDPRLVAITGERAAWHGRAADSWEYVMPWRVRPFEQRRLAASGARVRVAVVSGPGAAAALLGRPEGSR